MKRIDRTVIKETLFISIFVILFSVLMQSIFLIIDKWDTEVLFGNVLGAFTAIINFLLMGISIQKAMEKDEKNAKGFMKLSQSLRFIMLIAVAAIGYLVPFFNPISTVLPFIFPRLAIFFRPMFNKVMGGE